MHERWLPTTQEELEAAIADGRLDEGHRLDFKRQLGEGKNANIELAKDLAMFANDGGVLIYGVDEPESGIYEPRPIPLDGLRERIAQVAASRCEPPLYVDTYTISQNEQGDRGFVVVRIPASPNAPHMVDHKYYGRADTTRTRLADPQVREIMANRRQATLSIYKLLDADIQRDPIPEELRQNGHLHIVARPRFADRDLVLNEVTRSGGNWSTWLIKDLRSGHFEPRLGTWSPDLQKASTTSLRARGAALHDHYIGEDRTAAELNADPSKIGTYESGLIDLEIEEDGTFHLYAARGTDVREGATVVIPAVVCGLALRAVQVAARITKLTGYIGTWDFAIHLTDLQGAQRHDSGWRNQGPRYSADSYRESAAADTAELATDPRSVADSLIGRLLRGLGINGGTAAVFGGHG